MSLYELVPHLLHPPHAVQSVAVTVRLSGEGLHFAFLVTGDLESIVIPPPAAPRRADGLWETTCFEAFVRGDGAAYSEYNFSPSGEWAAYAFDDHRQGMRDTDAAMTIDCRRDSQTLAVDVALAVTLPDHARLAIAGHGIEGHHAQRDAGNHHDHQQFQQREAGRAAQPPAPSHCGKQSGKPGNYNSHEPMSASLPAPPGWPSAP